MNSFLSLLLFYILLGLGSSRGFSQETDTENRSLKFSCLYWEGKPQENLYYREGESFHPLKFKQAARSESFALKGMKNFELYREAIDPQEDEPPYTLLAQASLPTAKQVLLLVIPFEAQERTNYRVIAMDDSLSTFPTGTFRFANFTNQPLIIKFADKVEKLAAGKLVVMKCQSGKQGGFEPLLIGNSEGKTIFGTRLFGQPTSRDLAFISPPVKKGAMPRVKFITQLVPPTKNPE